MSNYTIKAIANESKRTFILEKYDKETLYTKFETLEFNKDDFEDMKCNTSDDWLQFLRTEDFYYTI